MNELDRIDETLEEKIKHLYAIKRTIAGVARELNTTEWHVKKTIDPEWHRKEKMRKQDRQYTEDKSSGKKYLDLSLKNPIYDPRRDGVRYPTSLTGILCGDPPPGRSALDERRNQNS